MKDYKIMFMGTPDIAAVHLKKLIDENFNVVCCVTQPDKPRGRGHKLMPSEVKSVALSYNIPVFQPESLKNEELLPILNSYKPDIILVVAYGKILPEYVLNFPRLGCINMHASLLPKYRGAAPIQWSVINGDKITGVTTMLMDKGLDTGDMLLQETIEIGEYETSEELFDRISILGASVLVKTINELENITPKPQNDDLATYASMITKEMGKINWCDDKRKIQKLICGMNSWPLAYTNYKGENVKVISVDYYEGDLNGENGQIIRYEKKKGLLVKCSDGGLWLKTIQFPGSKKMSVDDYLLGHEIEIGAILD